MLPAALFNSRKSGSFFTKYLGHAPLYCQIIVQFTNRSVLHIIYHDELSHKLLQKLLNKLFHQLLHKIYFISANVDMNF